MPEPKKSEYSKVAKAVEKVGLCVSGLIDEIESIYWSEGIEFSLAKQFAFQIIISVLTPIEAKIAQNLDSTPYFKYAECSKKKQDVKILRYQPKKVKPEMKIQPLERDKKDKQQDRPVYYLQKPIDFEIKQQNINSTLKIQEISPYHKHNINDKSKKENILLPLTDEQVELKIVAWVMDVASQGKFVTRLDLKQKIQSLTQNSNFLSTPSQFLSFLTRYRHLVSLFDHRSFSKKQIDFKNLCLLNPSCHSHAREGEQRQKLWASCEEDCIMSDKMKVKRGKPKEYQPRYRKNKLQFTKEYARKFLDENRPDLSSEDLNDLAEKIEKNAEEVYQKYDELQIFDY